MSVPSCGQCMFKFINFMFYSFLEHFVPIINECTDQFLDKLNEFADGKTEVQMKTEFLSLMFLLIGKVSKA